jgi:hypothetical protein
MNVRKTSREARRNLPRKILTVHEVALKLPMQIVTSVTQRADATAGAYFQWSNKAVASL